MKKGNQRKHPSYINIKVSNLFCHKMKLFSDVCREPQRLGQIFKAWWHHVWNKTPTWIFWSAAKCMFLFVLIFKSTNSYNNSLKLWKLGLLFNENSSKLRLVLVAKVKGLLSNLHWNSTMYMTANTPANTWPVYQSTLGQYGEYCWWNIGQLSVEYQSYNINLCS